MGADYLFQQDKPYDVSYDTGDKSIQCGRHVDAFKLWLMWKAKVQRKGSPPHTPAAQQSQIKTIIQIDNMYINSALTQSLI